MSAAHWVARGVLLFLLIALPVVSVFSSSPAEAQSNFPPITSYRTQASANYTSPGSETFWDKIPWTIAPLSATVSPGGGHTSQVLVKSVNDGYNIYVLFRWNDSQGPSYSGETEIYKAANGSLVPLDPAATANVTQLFYNSTYYYPDRVAILWFVGNQSQQQQAPVMQLGTDGAITGGAGNIWHWQANPTDNNLNDSSFPGGYTDPSGKAIFPPDNLSFAEDDYTNTTGFYVVPGSFGQNASNLNPYENPFLIQAGSSYSYTNKTWTVEMVRSFTTASPKYDVQLSSNSTYYLALAVWQGKLGESSNFKSVSQWYALTVSGKSAPGLNESQTTTSTTTPSSSSLSGSNVIVAGAVAVGTLIVGFAAGSMIRQGRRAT